MDNIHMSDASVSGSSTYGAVGFLIGGPLSVDQALFTDIDITVMPATGGDDADFDGDGDVDGADFLTWQRGVGGAGDFSDGDANGDNFVDGADLAIWEAQFGPPLAVASVVAIPEPNSLLLIVGASVSGLAWSSYPAVYGLRVEQRI